MDRWRVARHSCIARLALPGRDYVAGFARATGRLPAPRGGGSQLSYVVQLADWGTRKRGGWGLTANDEGGLARPSNRVGVLPSCARQASGAHQLTVSLRL